MRNLWIFIRKYNAFFLFCLFFATSLILLLNNNSYQRSWTLAVSREIIGKIYEEVGIVKNYLYLKEVNTTLVLENVRLRNKLQSALLTDHIKKYVPPDSVQKQQYSYTVARVVNNSIHQENNYLTINRGEKHGIEQGMGIICSNGIVGIVVNVSTNFARIQSLLHSESRFSASVNGNIGSLLWSEGTINAEVAILKDIPSHIKIKIGDTVVTSGYSLFPADIKIGTVKSAKLRGDNNFWDIQVALSTNFSNLEYVYVVNNKFAKEQEALETETKILVK